MSFQKITWLPGTYKNVSLNNYVARPSFKNQEGVFSDQVAKDVKSVFTFSKKSLATWSKKTTTSTRRSVGIPIPLLRSGDSISKMKKKISQ